MYKGCTRDVQGMYKGCTRDVQGMYKGCTRDVQGMYKGCTRDVQGMYKGCTRDVQGMYKGTTSSQHHRNPIATPGHRARAKARTKGPLQIFCWLQNARRQGSARASCNDFASRSIHPSQHQYAVIRPD